jgi:cytoskeletal protein CcmA (bactofilin family)
MDPLARKSDTIRAQLEAFRATQPGKDGKFASGSFATKLQLAAWQAREEELQRALREAEMTDGPGSPANSGPPALPAAANLLSRQLEIQGSVKFRNELLIEGKVEGEIAGEGMLRVAESAEVRGEIRTGSVTVLGKVNGNITVGGRCELKTGAQIVGDVKAGRLVIEEGATVVGNIAVTTQGSAAPDGPPPAA